MARGPRTSGFSASGIAGEVQDLARLVALGVGGPAALADAYNLYNRRNHYASQMQNQLMHPRDLLDNNRHYISFLFQKYKKRSINDAPFLRSDGAIRLPVPDGLKDSLDLDYGNANLGAATGAALEELAGSSGSGASMFQRAGSLLESGASAAQGYAAQTLANNAVGRIGMAVSGVTVNPFQTILFEKPQFKNHSFTWKLAPTDEIEQGIIRDIVRVFQYHALPGVSTGAAILFSFPSMVTVSLFPSSEFMYRFKPCVITSLAVNYAPGSGPSFNRGTGGPTSVTLQMNLKEIELWTQNDYLGPNAFNDPAALDEMRRRIDAGATGNGVQGQNQ